MILSGMTSTDAAARHELLPPPPTPDVVVNARCVIFEQGDERVVFVCGEPVYRYHRADAVAEKLLVAQAIEAGFAKPGELAAALSISLRTVHRDRKKYVDGGVVALTPDKPGPKGPRLGAAREAAIAKWHARGVTGREMARRLGISPSTVGQALDRLGLPKRRRPAEQTELTAAAAGTETVTDPHPRDGDPGSDTVGATAPAPAPPPARPRCAARSAAGSRASTFC